MSDFRKTGGAFRLLGVLTIAAIVVVAGGDPSFSNKAEIDPNALGIASQTHCGEKQVRFRITPDSPKRVVFDADRLTRYHRLCLSVLIEAGRDQTSDAPIHDLIYHQLLHKLAHKSARFYKGPDGEGVRLRDIADSREQLDLSRFDRIVFTNKEGAPHNSMAQAKFSRLLLQNAAYELERTDPDSDRARTLLALSLAIYRPVLEPIENGGLRNRAPCDLRPERQCSWFHAVTSRTRADAPLAGGTLNKQLIVINDLFAAAALLDEISGHEGFDYADKATEFRQAATEGYNQLSLSTGNTESGKPPNLVDYIPRDSDGALVSESWVYYAVNPVKQTAYFLKAAPYKNCRYHIINLEALYRTLSVFGDAVDPEVARVPHPELGTSAISFYLETYKSKLDDSLYRDSPSSGDGNFTGCLDGDRPLSDEALAFLTEFATGSANEPADPS
ncbi:hypothetical protein [Bauldia sp.]|uniref:hypothetical protein n=1 Tax=Bauldia sp. TaxID=2575872 RepID=UPI003BACA992